jgi:oxygen-independent coproporphyrinogen-3 oxidase
MCREIEQRAGRLKDPISSIYFGGGTPSILSAKEIEYLLEQLPKEKLESNAIEITLECNPEDLLPRNLRAWKRMGINRLSIGVQSLDDSILRFLNRNHTAKDVKSGIQNAQNAGFENISLDYIFGIPLQATKNILQELQLLEKYSPTHFSVYQLTVEPKTALAHQIKTLQTTLPHEEIVCEQFLKIHELLDSFGFEHYELSNYAKTGFVSKHNSNYWGGTPYIGIGPGAHSFVDGIRRWNVANNKKYVIQFNSNSYFDSEKLSDIERYNEAIILGLRTKSGLKLSSLSRTTMGKISDGLLTEIELWKDQNLAIEKNGCVVLTPQGWLVSDYLASKLIQTP